MKVSDWSSTFRSQLLQVVNTHGPWWGRTKKCVRVQKVGQSPSSELKLTFCVSSQFMGLPAFYHLKWSVRRSQDWMQHEPMRSGERNHPCPRHRLPQRVLVELYGATCTTFFMSKIQLPSRSSFHAALGSTCWVHLTSVCPMEYQHFWCEIIVHRLSKWDLGF
jgi:hypothetical protein